MAIQSATFPQFPDLPAEIRQSIWFYCLPNRVAQKDGPLFLDFVMEEQKCWSPRASCQNASPPLIASVCRESRHVASRWGRILPPKHHYNLASIWVQPRLDVLHINWIPAYDAYASAPAEPLMMFFYEAALCLDRMPVSLAAENLHPFHLEPLPGDEADYDYPLVNIMNPIENDVQYCYEFGDRPAISAISATLVFICLHTTKAQALDSGLFGILGDAPVQLVDFDDEDRLRAFYSLFQKGCSNHKRPEVAKLFDSILAPSFQPRVQT
ncbi:hypothetical protein TOPH_08952 [Tolypocladium ophioglossoides CBS 100239]|uniref:2EXR domain-containing protein n=1 Tax=Tolypocladium ophioglossoides (strain CBS 100239) TaxID=1163406 RepID=A0A0L0MX33_TOLOC|nr:hypothetical protein TOPH_08952 [Tolypocladium ophioglossoides CBS 100239]